VTLGELLTFLRGCDPTTRVPVGFGAPCSYRGDYADVAFRIAYATTAGVMLTHAERALGATFTGYTGGDYTMDEDVRCYLVEDESKKGEEIGPVLLAYMTGSDDTQVVCRRRTSRTGTREG
jgi:hypothetical protein